MSDQPSSGNRWEQAGSGQPAGGPSAGVQTAMPPTPPTVPPPADQPAASGRTGRFRRPVWLTGSRAQLSIGALVLALVLGVGGFLVGRATAPEGHEHGFPGHDGFHHGVPGPFPQEDGDDADGGGDAT